MLRFLYNGYLGFNQTVNSADGADLYRIKTEGDGYLFDGKVNGGSNMILTKSRFFRRTVRLRQRNSRWFVRFTAR